MSFDPEIKRRILERLEAVPNPRAKAVAAAMITPARRQREALQELAAWIKGAPDTPPDPAGRLARGS